MAAASFVSQPVLKAEAPDRALAALAPIAFETVSERLRTRRITSSELTRQCLDRIEATNHRGPALRAVIEVNPDATRLARALDAERKAGRTRGPLHGIPVLLKDNIDTADRNTTTAGSLALEGSIALQDAHIARRLREAGAVLLGKANMSEWANFRGWPSSSGWSARGGQARNPFVLDRSPIGSSSGSAIGPAAGLCCLAVGTETNGSIVMPAAACGVVGLKPTVGLLSRSGIIPISATQDTAGPMATTVRGVAALLTALSGRDPRDSATEYAPASQPVDYMALLTEGALRGARLGVARRLFPRNAATVRLMENALELLKGEGAELVNLPDLGADGFGNATIELMLYEFKAGLNAYLAGLGPKAPVRTLREVIEFNRNHADRELPFFGQNLFERAEEKGPLTEDAYLKARETCRRVARDEGIDKAMGEHRLDAIIAPTAGPAGPIDLVYGDRDTGGCSTLAAVAGYPHLTVPMGAVQELPVGFSFFGRAWSEARLLALGCAFERAAQVKVRPRFLPTVAGEPGNH